MTLPIKITITSEKQFSGQFTDLSLFPYRSTIHLGNMLTLPLPLLSFSLPDTHYLPFTTNPYPFAFQFIFPLSLSSKLLVFNPTAELLTSPPQKTPSRANSPNQQRGVESTSHPHPTPVLCVHSSSFWG